MKKFIALLLATAICLSLVACGKDNIRHPQEDHNNPAAPETQPPEADALPANLLPYLPALYGDWEVLKRDHVELMEDVVFSEDGTLQIGSQTYNWEYNDQSGTTFYFDILDGDRQVGSSQLYTENELKLEVDLDHIESSGRIFFYQPSRYKIVTITLDNWQEYFEIRTFEKFYENAFGEVTGCEITLQLWLKEEYQNGISEFLMYDPFDSNVIEQGAVEVSFDTGTRSVSVDPENRTYEFGNDFTKYRTETSIEIFTYNPDSGSFYAPLVTNFILDTEIASGKQHSHKENVEITRLKLDLYYIAE